MIVNVYRPMVRGIHGSASENNEGIRAETMENCNKHEHKRKHKEGTQQTLQQAITELQQRNSSTKHS